MAMVVGSLKEGLIGRAGLRVSTSAPAKKLYK